MNSGCEFMHVISSICISLSPILPELSGDDDILSIISRTFSDVGASIERSIEANLESEDWYVPHLPLAPAVNDYDDDDSCTDRSSESVMEMDADITDNSPAAHQFYEPY